MMPQKTLQKNHKGKVFQKKNVSGENKLQWVKTDMSQETVFWRSSVIRERTDSVVQNSACQ